MTTQSKVAAHKAKHPELYCPRPRCLWHTLGGLCPRHKAVCECLPQRPTAPYHRADCPVHGTKGEL